MVYKKVFKTYVYIIEPISFKKKYICNGRCVGGLVVEARTLEREVGGLIPTPVMLCP